MGPARSKARVAVAGEEVVVEFPVRPLPWKEARGSMKGRPLALVEEDGGAGEVGGEGGHGESESEGEGEGEGESGVGGGGGEGEVAVAAAVAAADLDHDAVVGLVQGLVSTLAGELGDGILTLGMKQFMERLNDSPTTAHLPPFRNRKKAQWNATIRAAIVAAVVPLMGLAEEKELKLMRAADTPAPA